MSKLKKCRQCGAARQGRICSQCGHEEKRGGPGRGGGPKPRLVLPAVIGRSLDSDLAQKLLADKGTKDRPSTEERWRAFRDHPDPWFRLSVEKYIWDRAKGRPVQQVRMGNPEGEKFDISVATSAREKLTALLGG